ncbi:Actin-related protein 6, partial [Fragariocoptes setiger]
MDNGAYTIKVGMASDENTALISNCKMKVKSERQRQFIGDQIEDCKDCSGLYYILTHQKGFIINWDVEREVWEYIIKKKFASLDPTLSTLIITEPYFDFRPIQNNIDEIMFEEYGFDSILRTNPGYLSTFSQELSNPKDNNQPLGCLVVDSGFSFTHVTPYIASDTTRFRKIKSGIRRIDIGGKALTNHLKELLSYRQINVMDETYVINQCKEDACFVSNNLDAAMKECKRNKNSFLREYVLPDFTTVKRGFVRNPENPEPISSEQQILRLVNERFQVPELLFNPSDVGIEQVGIVEAIVDSINSIPEKLRPHLFENILLTGGNALFEGFKERVFSGIRSYCPAEFKVNVTLASNPITNSWEGGRVLANQYPDLLKSMIITKKDYDESGDNKRQMCVDKFDV